MVPHKTNQPATLCFIIFAILCATTPVNGSTSPLSGDATLADQISDDVILGYLNPQEQRSFRTLCRVAYAHHVYNTLLTKLTQLESKITYKQSSWIAYLILKYAEIDQSHLQTQAAYICKNKPSPDVMPELKAAAQENLDYIKTALTALTDLADLFNTTTNNTATNNTADEISSLQAEFEHNCLTYEKINNIIERITKLDNEIAQKLKSVLSAPITYELKEVEIDANLLFEEANNTLTSAGGESIMNMLFKEKGSNGEYILSTSMRDAYTKYKEEFNNRLRLAIHRQQTEEVRKDIRDAVLSYQTTQATLQTTPSQALTTPPDIVATDIIATQAADADSEPEGATLLTTSTPSSTTPKSNDHLSPLSPSGKSTQLCDASDISSSTEPEGETLPLATTTASNNHVSPLSPSDESTSTQSCNVACLLPSSPTPHSLYSSDIDLATPLLSRPENTIEKLSTSLLKSALKLKEQNTFSKHIKQHSQPAEADESTTDESFTRQTTPTSSIDSSANSSTVTTPTSNRTLDDDDDNKEMTPIPMRPLINTPVQSQHKSSNKKTSSTKTTKPENTPPNATSQASTSKVCEMESESASTSNTASQQNTNLKEGLPIDQSTSANASSPNSLSNSLLVAPRANYPLEERGTITTSPSAPQALQPHATEKSTIHNSANNWRKIVAIISSIAALTTLSSSLYLTHKHRKKEVLKDLPRWQQFLIHKTRKLGIWQSKTQ